MKNLSLLKALPVGLLALSMSGCNSITAETVEPWQGKVWRATVSDQVVDTSKTRAPNAKWAALTRFDETRDRGIRMARVQFASGWDMVSANVAVPDQIEFSAIPKGTLVDVMAEKGPDNNYTTQRFTRILRIVCAHDDDECINAEKAAKRFKKVVEVDAEAVTKESGLTFSRRTTKEELDRFD
jgi:hypothetical protein